MERVREFAELQTKKRALNDELDAIDDRCKEIGPKILQEFEQEGVQSIKVPGQGTVHLHRQGWAKVVREGPEATPEERRRAADALKEAGVGQFVAETFNTNTVSAWMRELVREGEELPPELDGALVFEERFDVRLRRS